MTTQIDKPRNFALRVAAERKAGKSIPRNVALEVTYRCNLRCLHCGLSPRLNTNQPAELTFSEITGILDQLFETGVLGVTFTGGEALCRRDILDIMDYARERGLFSGLKTNGVLLTEAIADGLKKVDISTVDVSLYGATADTHELITGVPGSFKKTMAAIETLRGHDITVNIRNSIMKYNYKEDLQLRALCKQLGAPYLPDPKIFSKIGKPGSADCVRMDDQQLLDFFKNYPLNDVNKDLGWHVLCSAGRTQCAVSPEGDVYPCTVWRQSLGNLKQQSFTDIWRSDAFKAIRETTVDDFPTCKQCGLVYYCARCAGLVYLENSDISGPSTESCRLARAIKGVISDDH